MRTKTPLYDHKDWPFLKTKEELIFKYKEMYSDDTEESIENKVKSFIETNQSIEVVAPKPIEEDGVATAEELESLVVEYDGRDAFLFLWCCYVRFCGAFNGLLFDHLEPC
jgi:hypothetical protein